MKRGLAVPFRGSYILLVLAAWLAGWIPLLVEQGTAAEEGSRSHHMTHVPALAESVQAPQDWISEKTGATLPLEALFHDEQGGMVRLGQLINRPTLLLPVYYTCPSICSFDLANLAETVRRLNERGQGDYQVVTLSFNSEETPEIARAAKANYTPLLGENFSGKRWAFLTGDAVNIHRVTEAIGYRFVRQNDGIFLHPSALVAVDKNGRIIKYIYGSFISGDVELALQEAVEGRPATSIKRLLSFCFPANPRQNALVLRVLKIGSLAVLIAGGLWLIRLLRKKNPPQSPST